MTRGKHGISAAARQAVGEREKQIEAYQHNIRKLTAENAELRQKLDDQQAAHSQTVRVLKAQRDEGLSPMLSALQSQNEDLTRRAETAERAIAGIREELIRFWQRTIAHFEFAHKLKTLEAQDAAKDLLGHQSDWVPGDYKTAVKLGPKAVRAIQRAHGDRT